MENYQIQGNVESGTILSSAFSAPLFISNTTLEWIIRMLPTIIYLYLWWLNQPLDPFLLQLQTHMEIWGKVGPELIYQDIFGNSWKPQLRAFSQYINDVLYSLFQSSICGTATISAAYRPTLKAKKRHRKHSLFPPSGFLTFNTFKMPNWYKNIFICRINLILFQKFLFYFM